MGKIYVVSSKYMPNTAPTNRVLSFLHGFSELKVDVEAVFLSPDSKGSRYVGNLPHVTFNYMWNSLPCRNRLINRVAEEYFGWKFSRCLKSGDVVLLMNFGNVIFRVIGKTGVKVFHEKTEHPDVYSFRFFDVERYKRTVPLLDGLFVISTPLKEYFMSLGVSPEKIHIINMTVDYTRFSGLVKQSAEKYIAYCGTASNNKDGVDELIKSYSIVHERHPEVKLYIIGNAPDRRDASGNAALVRSAGLEGSVVFTGVISAERMPQVLKNATVLALDRPDSLQAKCGFPTKLGEYLLTENPVVVTSVGDIPRFLKDGDSAILAEPRSPSEFAAKLIWAIENTEQASAVGRAGARVAIREFNYLTETKKIINAISDEGLGSR